MARKTNQARLDKAAQLLRSQPGCKSGEYARMLGCHRQTFTRLLVQLDNRGVLLSEDEQGRLWPFGRSQDKK